MNAIIYTTNTGRTERYTRQLVQKTGPPVYVLASIDKHTAIRIGGII